MFHRNYVLCWTFIYLNGADVPWTLLEIIVISADVPYILCLIEQEQWFPLHWVLSYLRIATETLQVTNDSVEVFDFFSRSQSAILSEQRFVLYRTNYYDCWSYFPNHIYFYYYLCWLELFFYCIRIGNRSKFIMIKKT